MQNNEKKWCIKALIALAIGFITGGIIKYVLKLFLTNPAFELLIVLIIPVTMILALTIVHRMYLKEKEDTFI